jgi:toxin FitB
MGTRFLLDTNIVIYYCNGTMTQKANDFLQTEVDKGIYISVVTEIETLGHNSVLEYEAIVNKAFISSSILVELTRDVVEKTIEIKKLRKMKLPDAIIAATALVHDFTLISRNDGDFKKIAGLKYFNPFTDL